MLKTPDFSLIISSVMNNLSKDDCDGALPYLSLTSKFENVVRDLLAFRLHKKFQEQKFQLEQGWFAIAREKAFGTRKKADIAIFQRAQEEAFKLPVATIELKAVAQPRTIVPYLEELGNYLKNAKDSLREYHPDAHLTCLGLLLAREARALFPDRTGLFKEIIGKYKLLKPEQDPEQEKELNSVYSQCRRGTQSLSPEGSGKLCCGRDDYIGASVDLKWWLFSLR